MSKKRKGRARRKGRALRRRYGHSGSPNAVRMNVTGQLILDPVTLEAVIEHAVEQATEAVVPEVIAEAVEEAVPEAVAESMTHEGPSPYDNGYYG
jgi:hypothetical protein